MELKIKIKEVKEETRKLTPQETCMLLVSESKDMGLISECAADELHKLGFVGSYVCNRSIGFFRTETIRDATQDEYRAWAYLQLEKHCACPERKTKSLDCDDCFLSGACVASDFKTKIAKHILKGKEVILELV